MVTNTLVERLVLTEDLAPIPSPQGWNTMCLVGDPDEQVDLTDMRFSYATGGRMPSLSTERSWRTCNGAVAEAYSAEFARVVDQFSVFADTVRVRTAHPPRPDLLPGIVTERDDGDEETDPVPVRRSRRLGRLLGEAVRDTGRPLDPRGGDILDLDHWHGVVDRHLGLLDTDGTAVLVRRGFVPVLTEWLRLDALASGVRRRMIRANVALPADGIAFRTAAGRLAADVRNARAGLVDAFAADGLTALRDAGRVVERLQVDHPRGPDTVEVSLLFVERPATRAVTVAAIAMAPPPPREGYPLVLADGEQVHLDRPPWTMGTTIGVAHDG